MTTFDMSDAAYAQTPNDARHAKKMTDEVYGSTDVRSYSQAQIQAIHSVTSDCGLPGVHLFDSDKQHDGIVSGALRVGGELLHGAVDELFHDPGKLLQDVAVGAVATAVGAALLPEAAVGLAGAAAIGAVGLGLDVALGGNPIQQAGDFIHNTGTFIHDAGIVADPDGHSDKEVYLAHQSVHDAGGATMEVAATTVGGVGGVMAAPLVRAGAIAAYDAAAPVVSDAAGAALASVQPTVDAVSGVAAKVGTKAMEHINPMVSSVSDAASSAIGRIRPVVSNVADAAMERINPIMTGAAKFFAKSEAQTAESAATAATERGIVDDAATSAWPGAQSARLTGEDLLTRASIEAGRVGEPGGGFTYAVRNFTDEQEIRNYVQALAARSPGRGEELIKAILEEGQTGSRMPGTAGIWLDEALRTIPRDA